MSGDVKQIVHQCLADDPGAMLRLWDCFGGQVFALCYRMLGQWQDAEDAVQETFLRVNQHLARWDSRRAFEPWLLTIAANRCRSVLRAAVDNRPAARCSTTVPPISSPAHQLAQEQLAEEVDRALTGMRAEWALAFRLFHEDELSYEQIARQLGCPLGTVKTWVHRARAELVRQLRSRAVIER